MQPLAETPAAAPPNSGGAAAATYDAIPYSVQAFPQTHPDRLATIGRLFGLPTAPADACRVLELGCASGGNLIPLAEQYPRSRFVGVDLSRRQIEEGRATARELGGLPNLDLREASILDVTADWGTFDYVLAHGVYSWVPPTVRDKILEICATNLAKPAGVAYVSYNTYPGWHARGAVREMLCYHTARFDAPADRVREARALLKFLAASMPHRDGAFGVLVRQELALLNELPDTYLLHEHLDEVNEPLYFHQFAQRAAANGLQYLGEANVGSMVAGRLGEEVEGTLRRISPDLLHMEQYMDFLRNRMFRQTLLCHADAKVDHALRPDVVEGFRIASSVTAVGTDGDAVQFRTKDGLTLATRDPLMSEAMRRLTSEWPASAAFDDLFTAARGVTGGSEEGTEARGQLAARLLHAYTRSMVEFSLSPSRCVAHVSDRPRASAYARLRAGRGSRVTNLRLETVELGPLMGEILRQLDGTRGREELTDWIGIAATRRDGAPPVGEPAAYVEQALSTFARAALLVA